MDSKMFCFQCQQTAGCVGCMGNAACAANAPILPNFRIS